MQSKISSISTSSSVEKEKAEKLVTAALSDNETNSPSHQELKILVGEILANQYNFAKLAKIFHHQNFTLYGITQLVFNLCTALKFST